MIEILEPNFIFADDRGKLIQLVREGYKQINVVHSKAGALRGGHSHNFNKEAFYIIEGSLTLKLNQDGKKEEYSFSAGDMFAIKPGVIHSFNFLTDTLLVGMYDKGVEMEDGSKDILPQGDERP
ncbi:MAG: cupin domain-containing protein [Clostridiales bacterium]|nr:cupin domain-containing protein [Clostridiales bacterium]